MVHAHMLQQGHAGSATVDEPSQLVDENIGWADGARSRIELGSGCAQARIT